MATKTFVLSAGAILTSENSLLRFGDDNRIVIPLCILDKLRAYKGKYEKERIAAKILEYLDTLPATKYDMNTGTIQENGSTLIIARNFKDVKISEIGNVDEYDLRTLQTCKGLIEGKHQNVTLISKNPLLRMKAQILGIKAQNFRDELFPAIHEQYTGRREIEVSNEILKKMHNAKQIDVSEVSDSLGDNALIANEFIRLNCDKAKFLARYNAETKKIVALVTETYTDDTICRSVVPMNDGERFAIEAFTRPAKEAPLVIMKGPAGTGKTYCALGIGLELQEKNEYKRILISTPGEIVGEHEIGFLPGDIDAKLSPFLGGILTNLEILLNDSESSTKKKSGEQYEDGKYYFEKGIIKIQALGMVRGQSITNTYFIIDETQNIEPSDIKSIVTRAAKGSKFVFLGDPTQIDNPKLNERYNGLVYLSELMKDDPLCWQVTMDGDTESVRSELALSAIKKLCK